jgi:hypothetical protein
MDAGRELDALVAFIEHGMNATADASAREAVEAIGAAGIRRGDLARLLQQPNSATGPTQRLTRFCRACGDELPMNARFCIACGTAVVRKV